MDSIGSSLHDRAQGFILSGQSLLCWTSPLSSLLRTVPTLRQFSETATRSAAGKRESERAKKYPRFGSFGRLWNLVAQSFAFRTGFSCRSLALFLFLFSHSPSSPQEDGSTRQYQWSSQSGRQGGSRRSSRRSSPVSARANGGRGACSDSILWCVPLISFRVYLC